MRFGLTIPCVPHLAADRDHHCLNRLQSLPRPRAPRHTRNVPAHSTRPSTAHRGTATVFLFRPDRTLPAALRLLLCAGLPSTVRRLPAARWGSGLRFFETQSYASIHVSVF